MPFEAMWVMSRLSSIHGVSIERVLLDMCTLKAGDVTDTFFGTSQRDFFFPPHNSWVSVDTYEMVLISLILVVFLTGIVGNSLVVIAVTTTKSMQGGQKESCSVYP